MSAAKVQRAGSRGIFLRECRTAHYRHYAEHSDRHTIRDLRSGKFQRSSGNRSTTEILATTNDMTKSNMASAKNIAWLSSGGVP